MKKEVHRAICTETEKGKTINIQYNWVDEKNNNKVYGHAEEVWYDIGQMEKIKTQAEMDEIRKKTTINKLKRS